MDRTLDHEIAVQSAEKDYRVGVRDGVARQVDLLIHHDLGTGRRQVWRQGSIPGKAITSVLRDAGFGSTGSPVP